jgi:hypothetical protein
MAKRKQIFYVRKFLNRQHEHNGAFVLADIYSETWKYKKGTKKLERTNLYGDLEIADCSRHITLSIDGDSKRSRANTLRKLDLLIETLTGLRAALAKWFEDNPVK